jgi:hypothetical protein
MDIDERITIVKDLISKREEIDAKLAELFGGVAHAKSERACGKCGQTGHTSRTCSTHNANGTIEKAPASHLGAPE